MEQISVVSSPMRRSVVITLRPKGRPGKWAHAYGRGCRWGKGRIYLGPTADMEDIASEGRTDVEAGC